MHRDIPCHTTNTYYILNILAILRLSLFRVIVESPEDLMHSCRLQQIFTSILNRNRQLSTSICEIDWPLINRQGLELIVCVAWSDSRTSNSTRNILAITVGCTSSYINVAPSPA